MDSSELKEFLDAKVFQYNNQKFIDSDPIQIPHQFTLKEDIEISEFLTATIAWGNRKSIINNAKRMMELLDYSPHEFIINHTAQDLVRLESFVHRTFNGYDLVQFVKSLKHIYTNYSGLENIFSNYAEKVNLQFAIHKLKQHFFEIEYLPRTKKHISDPLNKSAAKRINMYLCIWGINTMLP